MATILLVEDNEMNRDMLTRYLRWQGYTVHIATQGAEAIEMAGSTQPDLILMDLSIPVIDGWEATRRIKANPKTGAIPIIALTAHALAEDRYRSMEAGCDDYETKPVSFARLTDKIRKLLGESPPAQQILID
jgi:two-component system, cell cycle response regulator DivK